jgi:predicted N-acetyltransferase YhbS
MISVREEVSHDIAAREALLHAAFGDARFRKTSERLRRGRLPASGLALVAEDDGELVGTVRLWDVSVGAGRASLLLGPLAVSAERQSCGLGSLLMREALGRAADLGHGSILLVGDAPYYNRFGFDAAATDGLRMPGPYEKHRFLGCELRSGSLSGAQGVLRATGALVPAAAPQRRVAVARGLRAAA